MLEEIRKKNGKGQLTDGKNYKYIGNIGYGPVFFGIIEG